MYMYINVLLLVQL